MEKETLTAKNKVVHNSWWMIILLILIILFSTNPSETQFKEFLKNDFKEQAKAEGIGLLGGPIASLANLSTIRNDYLIFSTYEISIFGDKYKYVGILNHFFQTD